MKVIKWIADSLIRQVVTIDSLGSFQPEAQQMQSLSSTSCRRNISGRQIYMYMAIVGLQKAFDRVP